MKKSKIQKSAELPDNEFFCVIYPKTNLPDNEIERLFQEELLQRAWITLKCRSFSKRHDQRYEAIIKIEKDKY